MVEKTIGNKKNDSVTVNYTLADSCADTTVVGATSSVSWLTATASTPSNHAGTITITATEDGSDVTRYAFVTPSINGEPCDNNRIKVTQSAGEPPEPEPCKKFIVDGGSIDADKTGGTGCDSAFLYYEGTPIFTPSSGEDWITINYYHWDTDPAGYMCSNYAYAPCVANNLMYEAGIEGISKIDDCRTASTSLSDYPQVVQDAINKTGEYKHALGTLSYIISENDGPERDCIVTFKVNSLECTSKKYVIHQSGSDTPTTCESCSDFGITDRVDYPVPADGYSSPTPVKELKTNCDPDGNFTVERKSGASFLISMSIAKQGAKSYLITATASENPSTTTELTEILSIKYNGTECATTTITQKKKGDVPEPCNNPCSDLTFIGLDSSRKITADADGGTYSFSYKCCKELLVEKSNETHDWYTLTVGTYDSNTQQATVTLVFEANQNNTRTSQLLLYPNPDKSGGPCVLKVVYIEQEGGSTSVGAKIKITSNNWNGRTSPAIGFYSDADSHVGGVQRYNSDTETSTLWTNTNATVTYIEFAENNVPRMTKISITAQITGQAPVSILSNADIPATLTGRIDFPSGKSFNTADFNNGSNTIFITFS